jgi:hypothetical protein
MAVYGIDEQGVARIKQAINDYRQEIFRYNVISVSGAPLNAAFKGTNVQSQINKMALRCQNKLDEFSRTVRDQFANETDKVLTNYKNFENSNTTISNAANQINIRS